MAEIKEIEEVNAKVAKDGLEIEYLVPVDPRRQTHYWYGADIAVILKDDYHLTISAKGDIDATLRDGKGNAIIRVLDNRESGSFVAAKLFIGSDSKLKDEVATGNLIFKKVNHWHLTVEKIASSAFDDTAVEYFYDMPLDSQEFSKAVDEVLLLISRGEIFTNPEKTEIKLALFKELHERCDPIEGGDYIKDVYIKGDNESIPDQYIGEDLLLDISKKFYIFFKSIMFVFARRKKVNLEIVIDPSYSERTYVVIYDCNTKRVLLDSGFKACNFNGMDDVAEEMYTYYQEIETTYSQEEPLLKEDLVSELQKVLDYLEHLSDQQLLIIRQSLSVRIQNCIDHITLPVKKAA